MKIFHFTDKNNIMVQTAARNTYGICLQSDKMLIG